MLSENRRPVGVIGANFEPGRTSSSTSPPSSSSRATRRHVLRTGSAALRSAIALADEVIAPSLAGAGLDPAAIQLVRVPGQAAAYALVREPALVPLVILRGSGDSTRALAAEGAAHGVRTLAHADGGGVLYLHSSAARGMASSLIANSLDRLGVCNRLNLLLIDEQLWDAWLPEVTASLTGLGIKASLPPHDHPLGYEWALDSAREATVTTFAYPAVRRRRPRSPTSRRQAWRRASPPRTPGRPRSSSAGRLRGRTGGIFERDDQAARRVQTRSSAPETGINPGSCAASPGLRVWSPSATCRRASSSWNAQRSPR